MSLRKVNAQSWLTEGTLKVAEGLSRRALWRLELAEGLPRSLAFRDRWSRVNELLQLQAFGWQGAGCGFGRGGSGQDVAAADGWQADALLPGTWAVRSFSAVLDAKPCFAGTLHADFLPQDSDSRSGRPVLYRMLAQHSYLAQGPGDLQFSKGDVLDVLSEGSSPALCTCTGQALEPAAGRGWGRDGFSSAVSGSGGAQS